MSKWHIFSTIREANGVQGIEVATGMNAYGDGPERTVARMFGLSDEDKATVLAAPELLDLAYQYRNDLRYPLADDSRERRLAAIDAVIAKIEAVAA